MADIVIDLLVVVLALACAYRIEPASPFGEAIHEDYLSAENTVYLRGLLACVVVCHHLAQSPRGILLFPIFAKVGYLTVSVFFFLSGYGLMKQHMGRPDYRKGFLLRRLPSVLVPYLIATVLYWAVYRFAGEPWTGKQILRGLVQGTPIVVASWYIVCIFAFYVAFWVLMHLCGKRYGWMVLGGLAYCGVYVWFCMARGYGSWWFNTVPVLIFGMFWALQEKKVTEFFRHRYRIAAPMVFVVFGVVYGVKMYLNSRADNRMISLSMTWCTATLFVLCVILVLMKVKLRSPMLLRLGKISLELYLCHYLFIILFYSPWIRIENNLLYVILVAGCSVIFAEGFHKLNNRILREYKNLLKNSEKDRRM